MGALSHEHREVDRERILSGRAGETELQGDDVISLLCSKVSSGFNNEGDLVRARVGGQTKSAALERIKARCWGWDWANRSGEGEGHGLERE